MAVYVLLVIVAIIGVVNIFVTLNKREKIDLTGSFKDVQDSIRENMKLMSDVVSDNQRDMNKLMSDKMSGLEQGLMNKQEAINNSLSASINAQEVRFKTFAVENENRLDNIRTSVSQSLEQIRKDNNQRLEEMRGVVDEKLHKTLEARLSESFKQVSERLEAVHQGLGDMQKLAGGVGDLKKILSNVKTRGIIGEYQLGAILDEVLSREQYEENIAVNPKSSERVEFAVKLPNDGEYVYLPIDSKFPGDSYAHLQEAYESGDKEAVAVAAKSLVQTLDNEAKDISTKYIVAPYTTDFAIMFLPTEGLYAEAVNRGLIELFMHKYKISIAGPSTLAALLNALQMGFRTLAIQERSAEVWRVLSAVKTEIDKYEDIVRKTIDKLDKANKDLESLVGTRTKAIQRKLRSVEQLENPDEAEDILNLND